MPIPSAAKLLLPALAVALAACAPTSSAPTQADQPVREGQQPARIQPGSAGDASADPGETTDPLNPTTETSASPSASAVIDPDAKVIYLTFDDGPWVPYTQQMLDVLAKNNATATFFVVGEMVKQHPDLIAKIKAAGHAIGNHTYDHPMLTRLSDAEVKSQLNKTLAAVGEQNMGACMRPPYGDTDDRVRRIVKSLGYKSILWTDWALDWEQPPIPEFLDSLRAATKDKANILLHDGGGDRPNTVKAVGIMLPKWQKQGYTFAAVPECAVPHA